MQEKEVVAEMNRRASSASKALVPRKVAYCSQDYFDRLYATLRTEMNTRVAKLEGQMVFHMNSCKDIRDFADKEFPPQRQRFERGLAVCDMVMHKFEIIISRLSKQKKLRQVFLVFKYLAKIERQKRNSRRNIMINFKK